MGDTIGEIRSGFALANELLPQIVAAIQALKSVFGWGNHQAAQALAAHLDPTQPTDPKVAAALDASQSNPVA
jgi:hypothetical protein